MSRPPVVTTTSGSLAGEAFADELSVFRGIPFAAPPVGDLRFRPPQAVSSWSGTRDATAFGPAAIQGVRRAPAGQTAFGAMFGPGALETSEDCLYLNVWTPGVDDASRPVMVWIHGGAFRMGTGASPSYDGALLARRGDVVIVTINYRLGLLGFLSSPELGVANLGLLDQVAALQWVQREIANFGGDPDRVTVFGESAGGKSVECLLAMPAAQGLFSQAILQSTYAPPMDADASAARTRQIAAELGIAGDELVKLREVDLDDLLAAEQTAMTAATTAAMTAGGAAGGAAAMGSGPVIDGAVLPVAPIDAVEAGGAAAIPVIIGTTLDEFRLFGAMMGGGDIDDAALEQRMNGVLGPKAAGDVSIAREAVDLYRTTMTARGAKAESADIFFAASTDRQFRQHSVRLAEAQAAHQPSTFMYLFTWPAVAFDGRLGACHAIELPFVFGTFDGPLGGLAGTGAQVEALATAVQDAWLGFAKAGVPQSDSLPTWPAYNTATRPTMVLGHDTLVEDAPMDAIRGFWRGLGVV